MRRRTLIALAQATATLLAVACSSSPTPRLDLPPSPVTSASSPVSPVATAKTRTLPMGNPEPPRVALGTHGAVASQEANATEVGIAILKRGGNAVDADVAVGFALAVTHPSAGNIGGGGFMVVRMHDGSKAAIDYRETAPGAASRDMYLDANKSST